MSDLQLPARLLNRCPSPRRRRLELGTGPAGADDAMQQQHRQLLPQSDAELQGKKGSAGAAVLQQEEELPAAERGRRLAAAAKECLDTWGGLDCLSERQKGLVGGRCCYGLKRWRLRHAAVRLAGALMPLMPACSSSTCRSRRRASSASLTSSSLATRSVPPPASTSE